MEMSASSPTVEASGLGNGRRRGCVSCRQQPCAPRMSRGRLDRTPRNLGLGRRSHSLGASGDGMIVQWLAVVHDPHRPIHPLVDHHQAILHRLEQPFDPTLGLPAIARPPPRPTPAQTDSRVPHRRSAPLPSARPATGRSYVFRIDGRQDPMLLDKPPESAHRRERALVRVEPRKHRATRVIDVGHQHAPRAGLLQPVKV